MKACAYVVGPADGAGAALMDMGRRLGFETVLPFEGIASAEQQASERPLLFFLFAAVDDPRRLKPVTDAVRFCPDPRVRFSPLIYFTKTPSLEGTRLCINMGFDDVITLPFTQARLERRLNRQIDRTCIYYEADGYFGPDRRSGLQDDSAHSGRGSGGQFRRLEIVRSLLTGVSILRDELQVVL